MHDKYGLLSSPIATVLRQMTIPMTLGMLSVLMFNLVDTYFISRLGTQALAAISYTFPVAFSVNCITMGIGIGLSTSIGRLLGQRAFQDAARFSMHGILLALILVILASMIGILTIEPLFSLLGASEPLLPLIKQYMFVWYLAVPFLVIPMAGNSVIRATGDTKTPAKIMILSGVLNGILDPLLIFGYGPFPELGIQGAAIASLLSWVGALLGSLHILYRDQMLTWPRLNIFMADAKKILKIGTPAALSNAMTPLSGAILMRLLSQHGTEAVAAYGAAQRIESILILVLVSLTSVLTPFMSQNFGANNPRRGFAGLFLSMRFSVLFQLIIFIMMVPLSIPLSALFSQDAQVRMLLWHYLLLVPFSYGFQGVLMMIVSALNALHLPIRAFSWSFMRLFVFTLPCAWIGSQLYQIEGLFIGIATGNIIGGVLGYFQALSLRRQYLNREETQSGN
ncbi:MATE family efflux transporter [Vibrio sp. PP-XX7]